MGKGENQWVPGFIVAYAGPELLFNLTMGITEKDMSTIYKKDTL